MTDDTPIYQSEITVGSVTIRATVDVIQGEPYATLTLEQLDHEGRLRVVTAVMDPDMWSITRNMCVESWIHVHEAWARHEDPDDGPREAA